MNAIEAIQPVTTVFQLFGLSVATSLHPSKLPYHWILKCYSVLLNAIRIAILATTIVTHMFCVRNRAHDMYATIDTILVCGIRLLEIVNSTEAFFKIRHETKMEENLIEIDNILIHRFNIDLKPTELRPSAIKRLIIWLCIVVFTLGGNLVLTQNQSDPFHFYLTYIPPFITTSLTFLQIIIWADLIRHRLHVVNRLINDLNQHNNKVDKTINHLKSISRQLCVNDLFGCSNGHIDASYDAGIFDQICIICDLHRRLWIQTNLVNERFKCSMVLNIGNDFVSLVSNLYFTFVCLKDQRSLSLIMTAVYFMNGMLHIFHISMLSRKCHHASIEAANIAYGIHNNQYVSKSIRLSSFVCTKKSRFNLKENS